MKMLTAFACLSLLASPAIADQQQADGTPQPTHALMLVSNTKHSLPHAHAVQLTATGDPAIDTDQHAVMANSLDIALNRLQMWAEDDPNIAKRQSSIHDILVRVANNPTTATPRERQLYNTVLQQTINVPSAGDGRKAIAATVRSALLEQMQTWPKYSFRSEARKWPDGTMVGVVKMIDTASESHAAVQFEVLSTDGGLTPMKRANTIADRMRTLQNVNPYWWNQLSTAPAGNDYFVQVAQGLPKGVLVTADPGYSKLMGKRNPKDLADNLVFRMRHGIDPPPKDSTLDRALAPTDEAVDARINGDDLFSQGNMDGALAAYKNAIAIDHNYLVAYLREADILIAQGKGPDAKDVLTASQSLEGLDASDQATITAEMTKAAKVSGQ